MEHQTTIGFNFSLVDTNKIKLKEKLNKFNLFLNQKSSSFGFELKHNGSEFKGNDCERIFDSIYFLLDNHSSDEELVIFSEFGNFSSEGKIDIEDGELEFEESVVISQYEQISIYVNTSLFYSSEIESFKNEGIGIAVEMNDIDGDYYEFEI